MKRYLLFLILPLFFACSKDDQPANLSANQTVSADCLKEATVTDFGILSSCYFDSTFTCEVIEVPEYYPISDENKEWLKTFCLNDFDRIFFHDEEGNETFIEVSGKSYLPLSTSMRGEKCQNDPNRTVSYCIKSEIAAVDLRVPIAMISFRLEIRNSFSGEAPDNIQNDLLVQASSFNTLSSGASYRFINHLLFKLDDGSSFPQDFFSEIEILDKKFKDVYTSLNNGVLTGTDPDALKIFYNKEFGIVSFIDNNGTQWVLND